MEDDTHRSQFHGQHRFILAGSAARAVSLTTSNYPSTSSQPSRDPANRTRSPSGPQHHRLGRRLGRDRATDCSGILSLGQPCLLVRGIHYLSLLTVKDEDSAQQPRLVANGGPITASANPILNPRKRGAFSTRRLSGFSSGLRSTEA